MSLASSSRRRGLRLRRCLDSNAWKDLETKENDLAPAELLLVGVVSMSIIDKIRSSLSRSNKELLPLQSEFLLRFCIAFEFPETMEEKDVNFCLLEKKNGGLVGVGATNKTEGRAGRDNDEITLTG